MKRTRGRSRSNIPFGLDVNYCSRGSEFGRGKERTYLRVLDAEILILAAKRGTQSVRHLTPSIVLCAQHTRADRIGVAALVRESANRERGIRLLVCRVLVDAQSPASAAFLGGISGARPVAVGRRG